jgi:formylmethanofuran dehydrogenase subunit E
MSKNPPSAHRAKPSVASITSSRSSYDNNGADGIAELLRARAPERKGSNDKTNFFDKYKEMQRSGSQASSSGTSRLLPGARRNSDDNDDERELVDSPQHSNQDLDDEASALPWATPALGASPVINKPEQREKKHYRQLTVGSESSSGSSRSGRHAGSSRETEEIVTPSQSLEGFHQTARRDRTDLRPLKQIHESDEDENERVVFGALSRPNLPRSESASTISTKDTRSTIHTRSRTAPVRRVKTCQKCGDQVGGARKFVERDGVVLCEADWKKMYLPTCRRCDKLIETRMVSADDGQLKGKWHAACFTCTGCDEPFEGKDFYVHAGRPWCQYHYAQET